MASFGDVGDPVDDVLAAVSARVPVDDRERASIERILAEVPRLARPFDEHADLVHVTGSALIVGRRGIVLLLHRRLGIWVQPGGHVDAGELPWEAAVREATEETGLPVRPLADPPELAHVDVHAASRGHTHFDLRYVLDGGDGDPAPPPEESQQVAWFTWDEALALADPGLVGILPLLAGYGRA